MKKFLNFLLFVFNENIRAMYTKEKNIFEHKQRKKMYKFI